MLPVHPLAYIVPEMSPEEYGELVRDIKANGLRQPIVIYNGQILDGRHRARACDKLGVEPAKVEFVGDAGGRFFFGMRE